MPMHNGSNMNIAELWTLAPRDALERLTEAARRTMGASVAMISYFTPGQQHVLSAAGPFAPYADMSRTDLKYSMCQYVTQSNAPVIANSVQGHDVLRQVLQSEANPIEAYIGVPIRNAKGEAVGTLCVYDYRVRQWCEIELALLTELSVLAIAQVEHTEEAASRPLAETALSDPKARPSVMTNTIPELIFERRKTGPTTWRYAFFGRAREHLAAISDETTGSDYLLDLIHPEDRNRVRDALQRATLAETDLDLTFRASEPGDTPRWLRSQSVVRHEADGTAIWDGLCSDISDIMEAHESAEAARLARETMLIDVNHELRTPLQAILGFADLLQTERRPDVVQTHASTIRNAAQALLSMVNQLLDVASTREGITPTVHHQPTDIRAVVKSCHAMVEPLASAKGIGSHLQIDDNVPASILADGPKIQQVLVNLLNNAIKFTNIGTVTLHVSSVSEGLHFSVSDTGIGIAGDKVKLLFQRFSQIPPEGPTAGGTGLGLWIAKQLVESMGGTIGVGSNAAQGTTFWFELAAEERIDVTPVTIDAMPATEEPAKKTTMRAHILIADDLDLNRKLIADMLTLDGHKVDCVCDGAEAVTAMTARSYDLILMDMIMPVMDGVAATRAIRALPSPACNVPIIALTANSFREQLETCLAAGMDATLTKPMSLDVLTTTVRSWTEGRSQAA